MYMLKFYNISERFKQEINESKYKRWILGEYEKISVNKILL